MIEALSEDLTKKFLSNGKGILNFLVAQDIGRMMTSLFLLKKPNGNKLKSKQNTGGVLR